MKVLELINRCDSKNVTDAWDRLYLNQFEHDKYPSDGIPEYLEYLKKITPVETEWSLVVKLEDPRINGMPSEGDEPFVHVYGVTPGSEETWAMELSPNADWLGFEIDVQLDEATPIEDILCHIIWEMTFMGWFDEDRKLIKDDLDERTTEIDKWIEEGTIDEHTTTLDEIKDICSKK